MILTTKLLKVNKVHEKVEMVHKKSLDEEDDVIITTKDSSQKKMLIRKEAVYPSKELNHLMETPPLKKFRAVSKFSATVGKASKNTLISSLPIGLREVSYFDNIDQ